MIMSLCRKYEPGFTVTDCVFFTSIYGPCAKHEGHELKRKKLGAKTYRTAQENELSKMFIISLGN